MKNNKKIFFGLFLALGVMIGLSLVSAATTINTPAASSTVGGATTFNITFTDYADLTNDFINLTIYAMSTSTANSSWSVIGTNNSLNGTASNNESITVIDLTDVLEDSNDYIFNVTSTNSTGGQILSQDTNIGITIDQTVPQTPSVSSPADGTLVSSSTTQTFTYTVTDSNTTLCTYTIYRGGSPSDGTAGTGTYSGTSCSFSSAFTDTTDNGDWYVTATASDGTNTSSTMTHFLVQLPGAGSGYVPPGSTSAGGGSVPPTEQSGNSWIWLLIAFGVVVILLIVFFVLHI